MPPSVLIADGWWQECLHCGVEVREDGEAQDDDGNHVDFQPVDHGDQVFCCPECQAKYFASKRANAAARAALQELVETRYPEAKVTRVHVYGDRLEASERGCGVNASAQFELPGLQDPVNFHFGEPYVYVTVRDLGIFKERYGAKDDTPAA